jgi:MFS family permease
VRRAPERDTLRKVARVRPAALLTGWKTNLPLPLQLLQLGNAVNSLGYGMVLPFEIIYLHQWRGFPIAVCGLILAAITATSAAATTPLGALLDRVRAKPLMVVGTLITAVGYGGYALATQPWQAFLCSVAAGFGISASSTANRTLMMTLVTREQRPSSIALSRVATNVGLGLGSTMGGAIVALAEHLSTFQLLYVANAVTYVIYGLVAYAVIPDVEPGRAGADQSSGTRATYIGALSNRTLLALLAANTLIVIPGLTLLVNILPAYVKSQTKVGPAVIGLLLLANTIFIVVAQLPVTRVVKRVRRTRAFAFVGVIWAAACLAVLPTTTMSPPLAAGLLIGVAVLFAIGECVYFVVIGATVADLASRGLLARYLALYALSLTIGQSAGPAVEGFLLSWSPRAVWWISAAGVAAIGLAIAALGKRIPDPLRASKASATGEALKD